MKVQSINNMSFGGIIEIPKTKYTAEQQKVCESIKKELTGRFDVWSTKEKFFEKIYDIDFFILPTHNDETRVTLYFANRYPNSVPKSGVSSKHNRFKVRDYGESDNLDDLYNDVMRARDKEMNKNILICSLYSVLIIAVCVLTNIGKISNAIKNRGNLIENIDTLTTKTDTIKANTADFLKITK